MKKNIHKTLFTILILLTPLFFHTQTSEVSPSANIPYDINKKFSVSELRFDLAILKDALVKCHPGLFWYQTAVEFEENYSQLKKSITRPMTETEFLNLVTPFVANIKCGHTDTDMSENFYKYGLPDLKVFPFGVRMIESKIYLMKNYSTNSAIAMGSEILSVNSISADSILRFLLTHQWTDGHIKSFSRIEHFFPAYCLASSTTLKSMF